MISLSERTRIALDRLPAGARSRFEQIVREVDETREGRPADQRLVQAAGAWMARLDDNLRLIYRPTPSGVHVDDLLDRTRYAA